MDLEPYFQRIGFTGKPDNTLQTLRDIHLLHPQAIAFENLTSFLSNKVSLQPAHVFNKLIVQGRGGYCFEQNLVLSAVLKQLGFQVSEHAARVVWRSPDMTLLPRTHKLLKIVVEGKPYIADVGFGGLTMTAPLLLEPDLVQASLHGESRITLSDNVYTIAAKLKNDWKAMYVFDLASQYPVDFEMANHYVSTYPESMFINNLLLGRADADCRHALQNRDYVKYNLDGSIEERRINDTGELLELIDQAFNIKLAGTVDIADLGNRFEKLD